MSDMDELVGSLDEFRTLDSHNNPTNINQNNNYMTENDAFDENNQLVATTDTNDGNVGYPMESCFGDEIEREAGGSIAERRAATCGFSSPMIDIARFKSISPLYSSSIVAQTSPYITIPAGISPTELLDSPVMLRYSQAPPSPTTGSYQLSPLNRESGTLDYMNPSISIPRGFEQPAEFPGFVKNPDTELSSDFENSKDKIDHFASQSCFEGDQQGSSSALKISEDGYNWRKYGQKLVKGCEFPRSYYKCTHPNCLVKKKIERSLYGDVAEINYKGSHNHSLPQPNHRSNSFAENGGVNELRGEEEREGGIVWRNIQPRVDSKDASSENLDAFSMAQMKYEVAGAHESSSRLIGHDEDDGKSLEDDAYLDESESKRRKIDLPIAETSVVSRGVREPRLLVQIKSDVDILDDGYRWRKYGQKVVKGNPNPRSYYKCTSPGCPVRKHVERACNDYKFVITAYDGKHDHTLPVAKSTTSAVAQPPYANAPKSSEPQIQHLSRRIDRIPDLGHDFMSSALNMYPLHFPNLQNPMGYNNSYNDGGMPSFPTSFLYDVPRPPPMMMPHGVNLYNMPAPVPSSSVVGQQQPVENDLDITTPKQEKI